VIVLRKQSTNFESGEVWVRHWAELRGAKEGYWKQGENQEIL